MLVFSPLPSAQLFEAACLAGVRLLGFTAAFFAGRVVSCSIYVLTAENIRESSIGETFQRSLTSPFGIALQLAMLALRVAASQVDWEKHLGREERESKKDG